MPNDEKFQTIDDVWPIPEPSRYPVPVLDIKNTYITLDGKRHKVADLLKKLVEVADQPATAGTAPTMASSDTGFAIGKSAVGGADPIGR